MKLDIKTNEVVYITINGTTYYIDDSTGEKIVQMWDDKNRLTQGIKTLN